MLGWVKTKDNFIMLKQKQVFYLENLFFYAFIHLEFFSSIPEIPKRLASSLKTSSAGILK